MKIYFYQQNKVTKNFDIYYYYFNQRDIYSTGTFFSNEIDAIKHIEYLNKQETTNYFDPDSFLGVMK